MMVEFPNFGMKRFKPIASLRWRVAAVKMRLSGWLSLLGTDAYIRGRWFLEKEAWKQKELHLYSRGGGLGDEMLSHSILAEIKRLNPECHITFYCRHKVLFEESPWVDELVTERPPDLYKKWIQLSYDHQIPPKRPIVTLMAECVGLKLRVDHLIPPPIQISPGFRETAAQWPRPLIVIQPRASKWTPNKDWPREHWQAFLDGLLAQAPECHVLEVGFEPLGLVANGAPERFTSIAGTTQPSEYIHTISQATLFIGPPSSGMHVANSFRVPSVIIFGGYESPLSYRYPQTEALYTAVPCAPCWKTTDCPYGRKCLSAIAAEEVVKRTIRLLGRAADASGEDGYTPTGEQYPTATGSPAVLAPIQSCGA